MERHFPVVGLSEPNVNLMKSVFLTAALLGSLSLVSPIVTSAQPAGKPATAGKKKPKKPKFGNALKEAEKVAGKPLTEAQKATVRAAAAERAEAMKPIQTKYRTTVAKALGLTLEQYEAKLKASKAKQPAKP